MKKLIALFTAMAFALTLGVAFAEEQAPAAAGKAPATTEKAPAKAKKAKKAKHVKKHKKEAAAPVAGTPATK
jgi:hypothetical protein